MCPVPTNQPTLTIFQQMLDKSFEEGVGMPFRYLYISAVWISCSPVWVLSTGLLLGHPWSEGKASFACGRAEGAAGRLSHPGTSPPTQGQGLCALLATTSPAAGRLASYWSVSRWGCCFLLYPTRTENFTSSLSLPSFPFGDFRYC